MGRTFRGAQRERRKKEFVKLRQQKKSKRTIEIEENTNGAKQTKYNGPDTFDDMEN